VSDFNEAQMRNIVHDKLEVFKQNEICPIEEDVEELKEENKVTAIALTKMNTTLSAIYGNGSGKKGILDEMKEDALLVKNNLTEETKRQATFRHEMRNSLEAIQLMNASQLKITAEQEAEKKEKKKQNVEWVKWVAGGIGVIIWEVFKIYVEPHLKGGH